MSHNLITLQKNNLSVTVHKFSHTRTLLNEVLLQTELDDVGKLEW